MKNTLIKVGRTKVDHALGFVYDECHKIYLVETPEDIAVAKGYGYDKVYPMEELEKVFVESCPLRFIAWANLRLPDVVPQCTKMVTFTYAGNRKSVQKFH